MRKLVSSRHAARSTPKSGKSWAGLSAPCRAASRDMRVKTEVPTSGGLGRRVGVSTVRPLGSPDEVGVGVLWEEVRAKTVVLQRYR
jgi:hypothetical protein